MESALALIHKINQVIINPLILLLFACAIIVFLYGVFEYMRDADSEDARGTGSRHMIWGVVGIFLMLSVFGIMNIIMNTIGANPDENGVSEIMGQ